MILPIVAKIHEKLSTDPLAQQVFACYTEGHRVSSYWFHRAYKHGCFCANKDFWELSDEERQALDVFFNTHNPSSVAKVLGQVGILDFESI